MYLLNNNKFISKDCTRVKLHTIEIKDMKFAPFHTCQPNTIRLHLRRRGARKCLYWTRENNEWLGIQLRKIYQLSGRKNSNVKRQFFKIAGIYRKKRLDGEKDGYFKRCWRACFRRAHREIRDAHVQSVRLHHVRPQWWDMNTNTATRSVHVAMWEFSLQWGKTRYKSYRWR